MFHFASEERWNSTVMLSGKSQQKKRGHFGGKSGWQAWKGEGKGREEREGAGLMKTNVL